jgi:hypothetical protein
MFGHLIFVSACIVAFFSELLEARSIVVHDGRPAKQPLKRLRLYRFGLQALRSTRWHHGQHSIDYAITWNQRKSTATCFNATSDDVQSKHPNPNADQSSRAEFVINRDLVLDNKEVETTSRYTPRRRSSWNSNTSTCPGYPMRILPTLRDRVRQLLHR